jgi:hypothetical protein
VQTPPNKCSRMVGTRCTTEKRNHFNTSYTFSNKNCQSYGVCYRMSSGTRTISTLVLLKLQILFFHSLNGHPTSKRKRRHKIHKGSDENSRLGRISITACTLSISCFNYNVTRKYIQKKCLQTRIPQIISTPGSIKNTTSEPEPTDK